MKIVNIVLLPLVILFCSAKIFALESTPQTAQKMHDRLDPKFALDAVTIVVDPKSGIVENTAAKELASLLTQMYPKQNFKIDTKRPTEGKAIVLGTLSRPGACEGLIQIQDLKKQGSYVLRNHKGDGIIVGFDARSLVHGVYAALEKQGCIFNLSCDHVPVVENESFTPSGWDIADAPVVGERLIFNWHNFLSGCTSWNLPEWQAYIRSAARLRYTSLIVHTYGNNPMTLFSHNKIVRPVGWFSTTVAGRDWGTQHVNDVRRLIGGDVFNQPIFGAQVAMVPDDQRVEAAKQLMRDVFSYAKEFGLDIQFAIDVDTITANPASIIDTFPDSARYTLKDKKGKTFEYPNPDTSEGQAYFTTMVSSLLRDYPQIDQVVAWTRSGNVSPFTRMTPEELPASMKAEYEVAIEANPSLAKDPHTAPMLAFSRITKAMRKGLDSSGHTKTTLAHGTWFFDHIPAADFFLPTDVSLIALDGQIAFGKPNLPPLYKSAVARRKVIPVLWAHHDDRTYIGRSYIPIPKLTSLLAESGMQGVGVIHWLNRPMDLFVRNLAEQSWTSTRDYSLKESCEKISRWVGFSYSNHKEFTAYLESWIQTHPQFGRETTDNFHPNKVSQEVARKIIDDANQRLILLDKIPTTSLDPKVRAWVEYYEGMEKFAISFHRNQAALNQSQEALEAGKIEEAIKAMEVVDPEKSIQLYHDTAFKPGITRGETAIIISLNLRWLSIFDEQRQALGMSPLQVRFAPTQHDPLAQAPGNNTYHVDPNGIRWNVYGTKETRLLVQRFSVPLKSNLSSKVWGDLGDTALFCGESWKWTALALPAGRYRIRALVAESNNAPASIEISALAKGVKPKREKSPTNLLPLTLPELSLNEKLAEIEIKDFEQIQVNVIPSTDPVWLSGLFIERIKS